MEKEYRGIEVIGAGLGRTGTNSLMLALEILGYDPCYHMHKVFKEKSAELWADAISGKPCDLDDAFRERKYRATCDFPTCMTWKEQLQKYPDAKVILTVRDPVKWYWSCRATIFKMMPGDPESPFGVKVCLFLGLGPVRGFGRLASLIMDKFFHHQQMHQENCIGLFNKHSETVQNECPKNKLLIFEVSQGWEPLCKFLGKPIPNQPFPNVNDTPQFQANIEEVNRIGWAITFIAGATVCGLLWAARYISIA